jgi:hypothetical protein
MCGGSAARPTPGGKAGGQQIAARRGFPIQHLAAGKDTGKRAQFQPMGNGAQLFSAMLTEIRALGEVLAE